MQLYGNPFDVELASFLCGLSIVLRDDTPPTSIANTLAGPLGGSPSDLYGPKTSDYPQYYYAIHGTQGVLLLGGTETATQASNLMDGYTGGPGDSVSNPVNNYLLTAALRVIDSITASGLGWPTQLLVAGHSLGGAIAENLVLRLLQNHRVPDVKLITFGAPKSGNQYDATSVGVCNPARWMTAEDPVPLVPPTFADTPLAALTTTLNGLRRYNNFVHPAGGTQITAAAAITAAVLPSDAVLTVTASLTAWLLSLTQGATSVHSPEAYRLRFDAWLLAHPSTPHQHFQGAKAEKPTPENARAMTISENVVLGQLATAGERQNAGPVIIPESERFVASKLGRIWIVSFGQTVVSVHNVKKSARSFARHGNAFLRVLPRAPLVDVSGLEGALASFLENGTVAGSGFSPIINTSL